MTLEAISTVAQVLMFVLGTMLIPYLRGLRATLDNTTEEIHKLQLQLVEIKGQIVPIESLRATIKTLEREQHRMQLAMAMAGIWQERNEE